MNQTPNAGVLAWLRDPGDAVGGEGLRRLGASVLRRVLPLIDRASARITADVPPVEACLTALDPTLSLRTVRACVVAITEETHDVFTYVLRPNARFQGFVPGSFVTLSLQIQGKTVQRSYSVSSAADRSGTFAITVKRVPGGLVSNFLAESLKLGDVIEISQAQGKFVLPSEIPERMLMISAGSGITPVMSMLRHLTAEHARSEITFLHFARSPKDLIFRAELERIAELFSNFKLVLCVEEADASWEGPRGRFSEALLENTAPDWREHAAFLCGPAPFMQVVIETFERCEADLAKLRFERFNVEFDASKFLNHAQVVRFLRSDRESISNRPRTLLEEAEACGVTMAFGCRTGNCGTCSCIKKSGVVVDIVTGIASGDGEERIYPCISIPKGRVELEA